MGTDTLVWTVARGEHLARVAETGEIEGDAELVAHLRAALLEPVTVFRHGTVASRDGTERVPIVLRPGDGRYMVARIRLLCAEGGCELVEATWR